MISLHEVEEDTIVGRGRLFDDLQVPILVERNTPTIRVVDPTFLEQVQ
jgi:hypothetical protein